MTNLLGVVFIAATLTNWVRSEFWEMKCDTCPGPPYWHQVREFYDVVPVRRVNVMDNGVLTELELCDTTGTPLMVTNWVFEIKGYVPTLVRAQSNALHRIHGATNHYPNLTPPFVPIPTRSNSQPQNK